MKKKLDTSPEYPLTTPMPYSLYRLPGTGNTGLAVLMIRKFEPIWSTSSLLMFEVSNENAFGIGVHVTWTDVSHAAE